MNKFALISGGLILFLILAFRPDDDPVVATFEPTGIMLDSMNNEVVLVYEDGLPAYYKSEVFTPVCNTGECLPVYVNFYWNLKGDYLRFDQPVNEILTKSDHVPFTKDDYELLDEILRGQDPRLGSPQPVKHSVSKGAQEGNSDAQAMPAPTVSMQLDKYELVDGVSGATLPQIQTQFVPGALYTTYTLWGLAHDSKIKMRNYTVNHLVEKHTNYFLSNKLVGCQVEAIDYLSRQEASKDSRVNVIISLIDTGNTDIKELALSQMYFNYLGKETVQDVLLKTYSNSADLTIKNLILTKWAYNVCPLSVISLLSKSLVKDEAHFIQLMALFENKIEFPEGFVSNAVEAYPKLKDENKVRLLNLLNNKKEYLSKEDWETINEMK